MDEPSLHNYGMNNLQQALGNVMTYFEKEHGYPIFEDRKVTITDSQGGCIWERTIHAPTHWSDLAVKVFAEKYFKMVPSKTDPTIMEMETSIEDAINRVVRTITLWSLEHKYFKDSESANTFETALYLAIVWQYGTFNSPVWFNVGIDEKPQCSACFIGSLEDNMGTMADHAIEYDSISGQQCLRNAIFKGGSGYGANWSKLRAEGEPLSKGGTSSGVLSFIKASNAYSGVLKSGGASRRAAEMVILDMDHPDIIDFVTAKSKEETKAQVLLQSGLFGDAGNIDNEIYSTISFQNQNFSINVDGYQWFQCLDGGTDSKWTTHWRTDPSHTQTLNAWDLWETICKSIVMCGDPGIKWSDNTNVCNPCGPENPIDSANPCGEFSFLHNTACNLASLKLTAFLPDKGKDTTIDDFNEHLFQDMTSLFLLAQDILCEASHYPSPAIKENSQEWRPLGLGYCDLGGLLMKCHLPYDSSQGRKAAATITRLMNQRAWLTSYWLALRVGSCAKYVRHKDSLLRFLDHQQVIDLDHNTWRYDDTKPPFPWVFRNFQTTLLAPTGTIGFVLDASTTGIEPEMMILKNKRWVGGAVTSTVSPAVRTALLHHFSEEQIDSWLSDPTHAASEIQNVLDTDPVFATAYGKNHLTPMAHVLMCAAVQPHLSGAISKTIAMPAGTTWQQVASLLETTWEKGLKSVTIYVDQSKAAQPLTQGVTPEVTQAETTAPVLKTPDLALEPVPNGIVEDSYNLLVNHLLKSGAPEMVDLLKTVMGHHTTPIRRKLNDFVFSHRRKFRVGTIEFFLHIGFFPEDWKVAELFIEVTKGGSTLNGLLGCWAIMVSIALQHNIPLDRIVEKFKYTRFEPAGFTSHESIRKAESIIDFIVRVLELEYNDEIAKQWSSSMQTSSQASSSESELPTVSTDGQVSLSFGNVNSNGGTYGVETGSIQEEDFAGPSYDHICNQCGSAMVRAGTCFRCLSCGQNEGVCG